MLLKKGARTLQCPPPIKNPPYNSINATIKALQTLLCQQPIHHIIYDKHHFTRVSALPVMAHIFTLWLFLVQILIVFQMCEAEVPAVVVFGDSSVDTGNNNFIPTIAKCNFKPYGRDFPGGSATGRFCNGRLPPDFISEAYGLPPTVPAYLDPMYSISDFASGVCFASAATGYDNVTADVLKVIPLWKQVEYYKEYQEKLRSYLGEEKANEIVREALYLISIGTNDFLVNYYTLPGRRHHFTIGQYQDFLIGLATDFLGQLYALGACKISLTGVPPMGCLPTERATNFKDPGNCVKKYNDIGLEFNRKLEALATKLNNQFNGLKIVNADANPILSQLIAEPSRYGFEVAEVGCCGTGTIEMGILCNQHNPFTCPDADKYVFWDAIHPSQRTNQIISEYLLTSLKANFK